MAEVVDLDPLEGRARAGAQLLPRDQVRVVLGLGHDDRVARADAETRGLLAADARGRVRHAVGHDVHRGRGVSSPDDLARVARADEARHRCPGSLEGLRRLLGKQVRAALHRRVVEAVEVGDRVENLGGSL